MQRSEHTANHHMHNAAQQRAHVAQVLGSSKVVQRQRYQRVAKKQHTRQDCLGSVVWFSVMLAASTLVGILLAY